MKKFSWGHGVVVFYSLFVVVWIVILMAVGRRDVGLVSKNYYEADLGFQKIMEARSVGRELEISVSNGAVEIHFPENWTSKTIVGEVRFLRPSDSQLDFSEKMTLAAGQPFSISSQKIKAGLWRVAIEGQADGQPFLKEAAITI